MDKGVDDLSVTKELSSSSTGGEEAEEQGSSSSSSNGWPRCNLAEDGQSVATESSVFFQRSTKSGKRVTFPEDEFLVRILLIPNEHGPRIEELAPCDPDTLAVGIEDMAVQGFSPVVQIETESRQKSGGNTLDITRFDSNHGLLAGVGVGKFTNAQNKTLGRGLCIQGKSTPTSPKPAPRRKVSTTNLNKHEANVLHKDSIRVENNPREVLTHKDNGRDPGKAVKEQSTIQSSSDILTRRKQRTRSAITTGRRRGTLGLHTKERHTLVMKHAQRKVRSANCAGGGSNVQENTLRKTSNHSNGHHEQNRTNVPSKGGPVSTPTKGKSSSMESLGICHISRSKSISCDNLKNVGISSTSSPRLLTGQTQGEFHITRGMRSAGPTKGNDTNSALSTTLPRIHPSPYRQSSLPSFGLRSVTFQDPGSARDRVDLTRNNPGSNCEDQDHALKQENTPVATRKLYAWHMANGTLGKNPLLETPCITPLLEHIPRTMADSVHTTSS